MTPAVCASILGFMGEPMTLAQAARRAGVSEKAARSHRDRHPEFAALLDQKEAETKAELIGNIRSAGSKNWTAIAWLLERTWPAEFARPEIRNEITNVNVAASDIAAAIHAGLAALAERHAPPGAPDVDDDPAQCAAAGVAPVTTVSTAPTVTRS
jgi:hypothetical protein